MFALKERLVSILALLVGVLALTLAIPVGLYNGLSDFTSIAMSSGGSITFTILYSLKWVFMLEAVMLILFSILAMCGIEKMKKGVKSYLIILSVIYIACVVLSFVNGLTPTWYYWVMMSVSLVTSIVALFEQKIVN